MKLSKYGGQFLSDILISLNILYDGGKHVHDISSIELQSLFKNILTINDIIYYVDDLIHIKNNIKYIC